MKNDCVGVSSLQSKPQNFNLNLNMSNFELVFTHFKSFVFKKYFAENKSEILDKLSIL